MGVAGDVDEVYRKSTIHRVLASEGVLERLARGLDATLLQIDVGECLGQRLEHDPLLLLDELERLGRTRLDYDIGPFDRVPPWQVSASLLLTTQAAYSLGPWRSQGITSLRAARP